MHNPSIIDTIVIPSAGGDIAKSQMLVECDRRIVVSLDLQNGKTSSARTVRKTSR